MSVQRFSADTIVGPSTSNGYQHALQSGQVYHRRDVNDFNSMSSGMTETNALMNNCQQHHQGRHMEIGTPDANNASSMSSNNNNFHDYNNATSQAAAIQQPPPQYNTTSAQHLFIQFHEALALEPKYQPNLFLPQQSNDGEITIGTRDGAAHVLRCLKVWYELPNDVLFTAINHVDRFLTKMKVRPKHMACISVGSLHLAIKQLGVEAIDTEDLVAISQCRCTARDLERMAEIIHNKLGVQMNSPPTSGLTFIRLFYHIFRLTAIDMGLIDFYDSSIVLSDLEQRMEILACDANCASIRPSELALVCICTQMDAASISKLEAGSTQIHGLVDYAIQLQKLCRIPDSSFFHTHDLVVKILSNYNGQQKMPYRQRLVWKLSSRTLRTLRPTDKLKVSSYLPTIEEDNNNLRYRTGSVSSEDGSEEDWPTSPVVAVCEQC
ncbi:unnamed protein product [Chironomus riparius]|uniref:Cyclin-like domain-containing protein n=1 Tax=Chironomus riparius TaxID=315576 RepID=A0A9N9WR95_9DIPT|nr:unnamed protein product [Chironomus riparius]